MQFLIIDDHEAYRDWLGHHLTSEWIDCEVVSHDPTGGSALPDGAVPADYDLIFLDYRWRGVSGMEILADLKRQENCPPIIFMTPQGDEQTTVAAIRAGADDVLPKASMGHEDFVCLVRAALGSDRGSAQAAPENDRGSDEEPTFSLKGHRLIRRLARGGVSTIYLMEDQRQERQVVVKVLTEVPDVDEEKTDFDRFLQEYELISAIRHPNVVKIFDLGIADDHAFIVMEYFPAGDLKSRIKRGVSPKEALDYLAQMASALAAIHRVGVLHRDLKPANVLRRDNESLALIDFGLAKRTVRAPDLTRRGEIFGTPYYMSPEQGHGGTVDQRSDIYSLGVIFFEMLTRKKPFAASSPMAVIYKHGHAEIPLLPEHLREWQDLIGKMMAKDPDDRPQSADELAALVQEGLKQCS
ncbi:MAG: protein kinase [Gammaproteobacteria bacterium]|nr:MAG: protein kinase [Gammaproteobacteria bacterium]